MAIKTSINKKMLKLPTVKQMPIINIKRNPHKRNNHGAVINGKASKKATNMSKKHTDMVINNKNRSSHTKDMDMDSKVKVAGTTSKASKAKDISITRATTDRAEARNYDLI